MDSEEDKKVYLVHSGFTFYTKCVDDELMPGIYEDEIIDWVVKGKWYRVLAVAGTKQLNNASFILSDLVSGRILEPTYESIAFPSHMFNIKDTQLYLVCNN